MKRVFYTTAALALAASFLFWRAEQRRVHRFDALIATAAARYGTDPALVTAVIRRESGFRPAVRGRVGEYGLMQVREPAGREWARDAGQAGFQPGDLLDPATNILAGTWYLARAQRRWRDRDDPDPFALAEYNAGLTHARRWAAAAPDRSAAGFLEAITFPSTRAYILDVLTHARPAP